jgi:hypothetical protein
MRGQKNKFHPLEKCYNYFSQSTIEEIDNTILTFGLTFGATAMITIHMIGITARITSDTYVN